MSDCDREIILKQVVNQLKSAYKKYKTTIYYDNYSAIQRSNLSKFEFEHSLNENDNYFTGIAEKLLNESDFNDLIEKICKKIDVFAFPKKMIDDESKNQNIIRNYNPSTNTIEKLYYFIDLDVLGHILGILWILRCGYLLDDKLYDNCYGNRLNTNLLNNLKKKNSNYYTDDKLDLTPSLFNPYYKNYESWRDNGLESVDNLLNNNKHAIMISMDLKEFYYRALIDFNEIRKDIIDTRIVIDEKYNYSECQLDTQINDQLTNFIEKVFNEYSSKFVRNYKIKSISNTKINPNHYFMIPLGFSPSLIISNWYLLGFDQVMLENVRPYYYGRYVDDILIVLGIHEKRESHGLQQLDELSDIEIVEKYLTPKDYPKVNLFNIDKIEDENSAKNIFKIYNQFFKNAKGNNIHYTYDALEIQDSKLQTYYFSYKYSNALIKNFKEEIRKNSSEFRLMHDLKSIMVDFRENLYRITYKESINKLRDIKKADINKFEISKILSRINWVSSDTTDIIDDELIIYLIGAFKGKLFEFISLWEKLFSMLLINDKYEELEELIEYIKSQINTLNFPIPKDSSFDYYIKDYNDELLNGYLNKFLISTLIRVFSLKNNDDILDIIKKTFPEEELNKEIPYCLFSNIQNNSLMKYPIRDVSRIAEKITKKENHPYDLIKGKIDHDRIYNGQYYPRFVKFHECVLNRIDMSIFTKEKAAKNDKNNSNAKNLNKKNKIDKNSKVISLKEHKLTPLNSEMQYNSLDNYLNDAIKDYFKINFLNPNPAQNFLRGNCNSDCEKEKNCPKKKYNSFKELKIINTLDEPKDIIKIGLLNTKLERSNFEERLLNNPNLTSKRFDKIKLLINDAIKKDVELLIMPEMYIPYEWVEKIVKISKDHQMAIIFGVEPIEHKNEVGNYIMAALPFTINNKYKECALVYRLKNYYSPKEEKRIKELGKTIRDAGDKQKYYMFVWNGIYIVPYYCYEITSIEDRSLFKSCCDIITVSELNRDTKYFDNILESLSRDLFCYCIQSNTSEYGGSCIIQPSSSTEKYLVKLKGGDDDYIVTHELDIKKLRDESKKFNMCGESDLKPKPPGFDYDISRKK